MFIGMQTNLHWPLLFHNKNLMKRFLLTLLTLVLALTTLSAQNEMSLDEAIHTARHQSVEALEARQAFISTYWAYRSYKASIL